MLDAAQFKKSLTEKAIFSSSTAAVLAVMEE